MKRKTIAIILAGLLFVILETQAQNSSELTLDNGNTTQPSHFKVDTNDGNSQMELLNTTTNSSSDAHTIFTLVSKRASGASNNGGATMLNLDYDYSINSSSGINKSSFVLRNDDLNNAYLSFWNYNTPSYSPFNESRLIEINSSGGWARMNLSSQHATKMKWEFDGNEKMQINSQGQLSLNTMSIPSVLGSTDLSDFKLFVNGGVLAKEVLVKNGWADYVFDSSYNLLSITDLEKFISKNKHLPNVPSSKDIENNGLPLGEIAKIQQEKIEELFLYIIQQQKEITALKKENKELESLSKRLANIEALLSNKK